ncbi:hypothetical protein NDU88_008051 [Pleurodeles waltl]|uniref:Uncharacterized protein n=1 Tax=Pleurodeles waltl TaxID=8319 RepID=A0AAV7PRS5_PLEWA|nr:hypothetical protein NDU88_008051 [Pleurodeles waltl]
MRLTGTGSYPHVASWTSLAATQAPSLGHPVMARSALGPTPPALPDPSQERTSCLRCGLAQKAPPSSPLSHQAGARPGRFHSTEGPAYPSVVKTHQHSCCTSRYQLGRNVVSARDMGKLTGARSGRGQLGDPSSRNSRGMLQL